MLDEARDRAEASPSATGAASPSSTCRELAEAMQRARRDPRPRPGAPARTPCSSFSLDTADPARGALLQKARELGAAIETQLLFFDLEWNEVPDERADELLAAPELGIRRPPPADAAPLPPAPALGARGARAHGDQRHRRLRLPAPLHRADLRSAGAAARPRRAGLARGGPLAAAGPGPRAARRGRRGRDRGAAARPATRAPSSSTLCSRTRRPRTGCAATRTGSRRATSRTRRATSRSRPLDRGSAGPLRPGTALVRAEGEAARASTGSPPTTAWPRCPTATTASPTRTPRRSCSTATATFSPELGEVADGVLHGRLHRRSAAPWQARRRLLLVHRALARTRT